MNKQANRITIYLVDDHNIFREGLNALFLGDPVYEITEEAATAEDFLRKLDFGLPDIALIDIDLPKMNGFELAKTLSKKHPEVKKLMLSSYKSKYSISESIKSGADGYLHKDTTKAEITRAIDTVLNGQPYFGASITNTIFDEFTSQVIEKSDKSGDGKYLSDREIEIIRLICNGLTYKEIANNLNISARTVESHKNNIQDKLNIHTIPELVRFALKNNYID